MFNLCIRAGPGVGFCVMMTVPNGIDDGAGRDRAGPGTLDLGTCLAADVGRMEQLSP
jgi:hypothetical protein